MIPTDEVHHFSEAFNPPTSTMYCGLYHLVNIQKAIEHKAHSPVEIVVLPIDSMVDLSIDFCMFIIIQETNEGFTNWIQLKWGHPQMEDL